MNASQIPERYLEMTADAVRLARAADERTRADDILRDLARRHPGASDQDVRTSIGYAARLLLDQHG